jgi:hypothetical protein
VLTANVNWDLLEGRVLPYLTGGVGYVRSRFGSFSANEVFAQGGFGAKVYMNEAWFVSPDVRFGYWYHVRASVGFGYSFRQ